MLTWQELLPSWLFELLTRLLSINHPLETDSDARMSNMPTSYRILVVSYTDAIYTVQFTPPTTEAKGSLKLMTSSVVGHHPLWLTCHSSDDSLVFTGLELDDGRLLAIKFDHSNGKGKVLADVSSGRKGLCTLATNSDALFVGNVGLVPSLLLRSFLSNTFIHHVVFIGNCQSLRTTAVILTIHY